MSSSIATHFRCSLALLLGALLVSGCSSSSDSNSVGSNGGPNIIEDVSISDSTNSDLNGTTASPDDSTTANDSTTVIEPSESTGGVDESTMANDSITVDEPSESTGGLGESAMADDANSVNEPDVSTGGLDEPTAADDANPVVEPDPELQAPFVTRIDFDITVPVYVSDSLQVQLSWGDRALSAGWVVDETWRVSDEFPSDTENLLSVTFYDRNGAVVLGSYESTFRTGTSPTEKVEIFADQFDTSRWDDDGDGVNNLDEAIAGTAPLTTPNPSTQSSVRVDFGITVPAIMSDALQVQLQWGDVEIAASWVGDESWSAFADLPADTEEPLTVTFFDRDGDLQLGSYITTYTTGNNGAEYFQIESRQINTHRFDDDVDGVSNFREIGGQTDPLANDSTIPVTFDLISERISLGRCSGCHSRWRNRDDLYGVLLGEVSRDDKKMVIPFEPEQSYLVEKLEGSMLKFGGSELAELVRAWITLGALEN